MCKKTKYFKYKNGFTFLFKVAYVVFPPGSSAWHATTNESRSKFE